MKNCHIKQVISLKKSGDRDGYYRLMKSIPMPLVWQRLLRKNGHKLPYRRAGIYPKQRRNLDIIGLVDSINKAAISIDLGLKGFAIRGKEQEGRISQELQFCEETDKDTLSSLTQAIQSFDDAFLALKAVDDSTLYQGAEQTHPHSKKYRVSGFPKDAFHIACIGHKTRLQNILRSPGIDLIEKTLLKQRFTNLSAAQEGYIEKQRKWLALEGNA
jgi:hypothetical protein